MLKKIRSLTDQYALLSAFIVFVLFDLLLVGLGRILSLLPGTLPMAYFAEVVLILLPVGLVFFFGFSRAFTKGSFLRGLLCILPFATVQLLPLAVFFSENVGNPEVSFKPWYLIVYGVFGILGIGIREECFYRATVQNILAKKYANSVKGIWITVLVGAAIFGLSHATNLFFGMDPFAVFTQVVTTACLGLLFGAVYLRSGNLWILILVHTLTDLAGLAGSTFLRNYSDIEDMNRLTMSWMSLVVHLIYVGLAIFLLRPSKCKEIRESFCFAKEETETATCS